MWCNSLYERACAGSGTRYNPNPSQSVKETGASGAKKLALVTGQTTDNAAPVRTTDCPGCYHAERNRHKVGLTRVDGGSGMGISEVERTR